MRTHHRSAQHTMLIAQKVRNNKHKNTYRFSRECLVQYHRKESVGATKVFLPNEQTLTFPPLFFVLYFTPQIHTHTGDIVMLENIWTECEAVWLQALVDCMHQHVPLSPLFYEERAFGNPKKKDTYGLYKEKGGNYVTYLTGVLHRFLPGVAHSLYQAMTLAYEYAHWDHHAPALAAGKYSQVVTEHNNHYDNKKDDYGYGWIYEDDDDKAEKKAIRNKGLPHPMTMGLRTAEFLEYHTTGRLGQHRDENSIYTISVALSDPEDYKGGYFQLSPQDVLFKMPRLSGIVFFGETLHGITPITAGRRRVFVMELWPLDHGPVGSARPNIEDME